MELKENLKKEKNKVISSNNQKQYARESGIELIKIFAIFLIIISHVVGTLNTENKFISYQGYVLDLTIATSDMQRLILAFLGGFGAWGNNIFFVCSSWFLVESKKFNKKKWMNIFIEVWSISFIILTIAYIWKGDEISSKIIIKSLLPTTFGNNWYITCYLIFYPIHPILNEIVEWMNKQSLFRLSLSMAILYIGFDFLVGDLFFSSPIILWITVYFIIAYIKLYLKKFVDNISLNIFLLIMGLVGQIGIIFLTNYLGLHITFFKNQLLHWNKNCSPFLILTSIAMFNLARNKHFTSKFINYISNLALLIYIIHENLILRTYYRPYVINYIYQNNGYSQILIWVFILSAAIFIFAFICAVIYEKTLQKFISIFSERLYFLLKKIYIKVEIHLLQMK